MTISDTEDNKAGNQTATGADNAQTTDAGNQAGAGNDNTGKDNSGSTGGSKAGSTAKKNEDGSITFKNQDELDGFMARMYKKGATKAEKTKSAETIAQDTTTQDTAGSQTAENTLPVDYIASKIGIEMAKKGIEPARIERASLLVNQANVLVNGQLDATKLSEEIDAVISEFPELKAKTAADSEEKGGFKFGSDGGKGDDSNDSILTNIFGKRKER